MILPADIEEDIDAELAKAEPEPVAWIRQHQLDHNDYEFALSSQWDKLAFPVYTSPPSRKPLSDREIEKILCDIAPTEFSLAWRPEAVTKYDLAIARAIEKAHGIGEK